MATDEQADEVFKIAEMLAQHGTDSGSETAYRSAVSRGYYSVFLAGRRRANISNPNDVHSAVISACHRKLGYVVTGKFRMLKELRVAADYFVDPAPNIDAKPSHDLADWRENWNYAQASATHIRKKLKEWMP